MQTNVLGTELGVCCTSPMTGFYRTGCCESGGDDIGVHAVCVLVTDDFLAYSKSVGNDLSTPMPQYGFPGLKEGDKWCLCAARWAEADEANMAPLVVLESTHVRALEFIELARLRLHAAA